MNTSYRRRGLSSTLSILLALILASGCTPTPGTAIPTSTQAISSAIAAEVLSVAVTGAPGAYQFAVEVRSPDLGCQQYADWWEIIDPEGKLIYRRILTHSHVEEQPFVRSGGPVSIQVETMVIVRAHMHPTGYGGSALRGSVLAGFEKVELGADFAAGLAGTPPLPEGCDF